MRLTGGAAPTHQVILQRPDPTISAEYIKTWANSGTTADTWLQRGGIRSDGWMILSGGLILDGVTIGTGSTLYTDGQGLTVASNVFSLNAAHSGTTIEAITLLSGSLVHAQNNLTSSGALQIDGV